jgi:triosephosphate isomerase
MRVAMIGGNWKMYKVPATTNSFFETFRPLVESSRNCEMVIFPSLFELDAAVTGARGTRIQIDAQNLCWATEGVFTGEVSASMISISKLSGAQFAKTVIAYEPVWAMGAGQAAAPEVAAAAHRSIRAQARGQLWRTSGKQCSHPIRA